MKTINAVSVRSYNKPAEGMKPATTVFVYAIQGGAAVQEHYANAVRLQINQKTGLPVEPIAELDGQGEDAKPTGRYLYFTTIFAGENIIIGFKQDGTPFLDNSSLAKMGSMITQAARQSPELATAMAQVAAAHLLGINTGRTLAPSSTQTEGRGLNRIDVDGGFNNQGPNSEQPEPEDTPSVEATVSAGGADPSEL